MRSSHPFRITIDLFDLIVKGGPFVKGRHVVGWNRRTGDLMKTNRRTIQLEGGFTRQWIPLLDGPLDRIVGRIEVTGRRTIVCDSRHHLAEVLDRSLLGGDAQFDAQIEKAGHEMVRLGLRSVRQAEPLSRYIMALEDETDLGQKGCLSRFLLQIIAFGSSSPSLLLRQTPRHLR